MRGTSKIHGDAVEHLRLDLARPFQQRRIVRCELLHRLPQRFHLLLAVVGERFNARQQHHGHRILDHQRVAIHAFHEVTARARLQGQGRIGLLVAEGQHQDRQAAMLPMHFPDETQVLRSHDLGEEQAGAQASHHRQAGLFAQRFTAHLQAGITADPAAQCVAPHLGAVHDQNAPGRLPSVPPGRGLRGCFHQARLGVPAEPFGRPRSTEQMFRTRVAPPASFIT